MLTWPHAETDWAGRIESVNPVFAEIGAHIARHESLLSVCCSSRHVSDVRQLLRAQGARPEKLHFAVARSNDTWARDHGPLTTLHDACAQLNDFTFNGWGGKHEAGSDNAISRRLEVQNVFPGTPMQTCAMVLEGGAIETDGLGTLLATRSSVVSGSRNPGQSEQAIERALRAWLGIERFLWLDHGGISGDDTDGHIDNLARFADPGTILYATAPEGDDDHAGLAAMADQLRGFRTPDNRPYDLLPLPFPGIHRDAQGRRLPASYANFLIVNQAVLLPTYGVAQDSEAEAVLQRAFPQHEIVPIDCRRLIEQNGSLHCLGMQFPLEVTLNDGVEIVAA